MNDSKMNDRGISLINNDFSSNILYKYTRFRSPRLRLPSLVFLFHPYGPILQHLMVEQVNVHNVLNVFNRHRHHYLVNQHIHFLVDLCMRISPPCISSSSPDLSFPAGAAPFVFKEPAVPAPGFVAGPGETIYLSSKISQESPIPPGHFKPGESRFYHTALSYRTTTAAAISNLTGHFHRKTTAVAIKNLASYLYEHLGYSSVYKNQLKFDYVDNTFLEEANISHMFFLELQRLFKTNHYSTTNTLASQIFSSHGVIGNPETARNAVEFSQTTGRSVYHSAPNIFYPVDHLFSHHLHQDSPGVNRELKIHQQAQPLHQGHIQAKPGSDSRDREINKPARTSYLEHIQAKTDGDGYREVGNYPPARVVHPGKGETTNQRGSFPGSGKKLTVASIPLLRPLAINSIKSIALPAAHLPESFSQRAHQQTGIKMVHRSADEPGKGNDGNGNVIPRSNNVNGAAGVKPGSFDQGITYNISLHRAVKDLKEPMTGPTSISQWVPMEMVHFLALSPGIGNEKPGESSISRINGPQESGMVPEIRYFNPMRQVEKNVKQSLAALEQTGQSIKRTVDREDQVNLANERAPGRQLPVFPKVDINMNRLTDQVYRLLERKIKAEKERRGW